MVYIKKITNNFFFALDFAKIIELHIVQTSHAIWVDKIADVMIYKKDQ